MLRTLQFVMWRLWFNNDLYSRQLGSRVPDYSVYSVSGEPLLVVQFKQENVLFPLKALLLYYNYYISAVHLKREWWKLHKLSRTGNFIHVLFHYFICSLFTNKNLFANIMILFWVLLSFKGTNTRVLDFFRECVKCGNIYILYLYCVLAYLVSTIHTQECGCGQNW